MNHLPEPEQKSALAIVRFRILVAWVSFVGLCLFAYLRSKASYQHFSALVIVAASALIALLSAEVFKSNGRTRSNPIFLNLVIFFGFNSIQWPIWTLMSPILEGKNAYWIVYYLQYYLGLYFLLMLFSTSYILAGSTMRSLSTIKKYLLVCLVSLAPCLFVFGPCIVNPLYLYTTVDVADFKIVRSAVHSLDTCSTASSIRHDLASSIKLTEEDNPNTEKRLSETDKNERVAELLQYVKGDDYALLVYRPLYKGGQLMSVLSLICLILSSGSRYLNDPPEPAFTEKIEMSLMLYCIFEVLHWSVLSRTHSYEDSDYFLQLGQYFSAGAMTLLSISLYSRLRFLLSVEGRYYAHMIGKDATRITRWRDGFDDLVLKHFFFTNRLSRRFLQRRKSDDPD